MADRRWGDGGEKWLDVGDGDGLVFVEISCVMEVAQVAAIFILRPGSQLQDCSAHKQNVGQAEIKKVFPETHL